MKKFLFLSLSLLSIFAFAQVSYLSTDFASIGYSQFVSNSVNDADYNFVETGTNFNWNYNGLVAINQENVSFINPNDTGYKLAWCFLNNYLFNCNSQFNNNFNLATKLIEDAALEGFGAENVYAHMFKTANNVQNRMIGAQVTVDGQTVPLILSYTQPDTIYTFPFTFGSTSTSVSQVALDLNTFNFPVIITIAQERINNVEGWGSLTTPFGTFDNVLKMKTVLNTLTNIDNDGEITEIPTITHEYKWFDKAHGIPVLEVSGQVVEGVWTATTVRYIDTQLSTNMPSLDEVVIYPNPTNGELFVNLPSEQIKAITVFNLFGQEVGQSLNLSHLTAGFYLVTIETEMGKISKKVLKR